VEHELLEEEIMDRPKRPKKIKFAFPSRNTIREYFIISDGGTIKIVEEMDEEDCFRPSHVRLTDLIAALENASIPVSEVTVDWADNTDYGYFYIIRSQDIPDEQYVREVDEWGRKQNQEEFVDYPIRYKQYEENLIVWRRLLEEKKIRDAQVKLDKLNEKRN
jgi:hypothetical protein